MHSIRNSPTPTETVTISTVLSIAGTFVASTCKSGSAIVMATPSRKLTARMNQSFLDFVIFAPMRFPMRDMESSAPSVNSPMPRIRSPEPSRNESISPTSTRTSARHSTATIAVTGKTDAAASFSFSANTRYCKFLLLPNDCPRSRLPWTLRTYFAVIVPDFTRFYQLRNLNKSKQFVNSQKICREAIAFRQIFVHGAYAFLSSLRQLAQMFLPL